MTEESEATKKEQSEQKVPEILPVDKEKVELLLDKINGTVFKFDNMFFRVNYVHKGKRRFSAELLNPIRSINISKETTSAPQTPSA